MCVGKTQKKRQSVSMPATCLTSDDTLAPFQKLSGEEGKKSSLNSSGLDAYRRRHGALSLPLSVAASHAQTEICARTRCRRNTRALVSLLFAHTHTTTHTEREEHSENVAECLWVQCNRWS